MVARNRIADTKGKITIGGVETNAIYYRAYIDSAPFLNLNNGKTGVNLRALNGSPATDKVVALHFELARGTGSVSGLSGAFSESVNYTIAYQ